MMFFFYACSAVGMQCVRYGLHYIHSHERESLLFWKSEMLFFFFVIAHRNRHGLLIRVRFIFFVVVAAFFLFSTCWYDGVIFDSELLLYNWYRSNNLPFLLFINKCLLLKKFCFCFWADFLCRFRLNSTFESIIWENQAQA